MKIYYLDVYLKNGEKLETYIETIHNQETLLTHIRNMCEKSKNFIKLNLNGNGNLIIIKLSEIVCVEIRKMEEVNNAERI